MSDLPRHQMPLPIENEADIEEAIQAKRLQRAIRQSVRSIEYLHRPVENDPGTCIECWQQMPCATRRAIVELKLTAGIEDEITGAEDDTEVEFGESHIGEDPIPGLEPPPDPGTWDGVDWRDYE